LIGPPVCIQGADRDLLQGAKGIVTEARIGGAVAMLSTAPFGKKSRVRVPLDPGTLRTLVGWLMTLPAPS
jgi:hypothetical protein